MSEMTAERYPPQMGNHERYYAYTPLKSPFEMSWGPKDCDTCHEPQLAWAYPLNAVTYPRQVDAEGTVRVIAHAAQQWFACARCWSYIERDEWEELAVELGVEPGAFDRLARARMSAPGHAFNRRPMGG